MDPEAENPYWRSSYSGRPYVTPGASYDDCGPAYRYGVDAYSRFPDRRLEDIDQDLERDRRSRRGKSNPDWGPPRLSRRLEPAERQRRTRGPGRLGPRRPLRPAGNEKSQHGVLAFSIRSLVRIRKFGGP